jgi:hypothetical protein
LVATVHDALGLFQHGGAGQPKRLGKPVEAVHDAERLVLGRRGGLGEGDAALVVDGDHVRERAADVDADAIHALSPARRP